MTSRPLCSPQTRQSTISDPRNRLPLSPQFVSPQLSAERLAFCQSKIAKVVSASAEKRLFDGTGRANDESNQLVRLGEKLHSESELQQALVKFTAAIADKDKCKANDLSHAQAYLGAAAIFECQGEVQRALDQYLIGSRILNRLQQNPTLLAGTYVRIALIYVGMGKYHYPKAIEFFKKARKIYGLSGDTQHIAKVSNELSKIYLKQGQTKVAEKYANEAGEVKLFQNGQGFLQDYLELHTKTDREVSVLSSRSSVDTEPSPLRECKLPSIHVGCSPTRSILFNQNVGTSPEQKKDSSSSPMQIGRLNKGVGSTPQSIQETASSPIKGSMLPSIHVGCSPMQMILVDQNFGTSPGQQKDSNCSPMHVDRQNKGVGSTPQSIQETASSPIRIERNELSSIIEQLKNYRPGFIERGKAEVAKALLERSEKFAKGEISLDAVQAYIDAHFDIKDNPALAGFRTHKLKDIFDKARGAIELAQKDKLA